MHRSWQFSKSVCESFFFFTYNKGIHTTYLRKSAWFLYMGEKEDRRLHTVCPTELCPTLDFNNFYIRPDLDPKSFSATYLMQSQRTQTVELVRS